MHILFTFSQKSVFDQTIIGMLLGFFPLLKTLAFSRIALTDFNALRVFREIWKKYNSKNWEQIAFYTLLHCQEIAPWMWLWFSSTLVSLINLQNTIVSLSAAIDYSETP